MPFATIDAVCVQTVITPREICVRFPVGNEVCVSLPQSANADPSELLQQMFGMINSALAPLNPIFNIIDAVIAVFECIKAIPKAITQLNPKPLLDCLPTLAEAIGKLIQLIPQLSMPILIVDIIDVIILFLQEAANSLGRLSSRQLSLSAANVKAAEPGNVGLRLAMDCINNNFDADVANLNAQMAPLNRLLGIIDFILELTGLKSLLSAAGVTVVPCLGSLNLKTGANVIQKLVDLLSAIRSAIPIPGGSGSGVSAPLDTSEC